MTMADEDFKRRIAAQVARKLGQADEVVVERLRELAADPTLELPPVDHIMLIPDSITPVTGWRAWNIDTSRPDRPLLHSVTYGDYHWAPRVIQEAHCAKDDHEPAGKHCGCGFYSAKTYDHLMSMAYHEYQLDSGTLSVVGEVANWGNVVEGTQGWRAQFSYPQIIYVPFEAWPYAQRLQDLYGVPVKLKNFLGQEFPIPLANESEPIAKGVN